MYILTGFPTRHLRLFESCWTIRFAINHIQFGIIVIVYGGADEFQLVDYFIYVGFVRVEEICCFGYVTV